MEIQVLISKKGTKVVTATQLHQALELPHQHYPVNVRKWIKDVYNFQDGIRRPVAMKDYGVRKWKDNPIVEDYYLTIEMAKHIALHSRSRVKMAISRQLVAHEDVLEQGDLLTKEQVLAVLDLTKAMGLVSCQDACERRHLETYEQRNGGRATDWWQYRSEVLGYSVDALRERLRKSGLKVNGKNRKQLLMRSDKHELVRTAVIDLFMSMGKRESYARVMGDLAKVFAKELNVEIFDDRDDALALAPAVNPTVVEEVKAGAKGAVLSCW
ncbi:MAG: antA/AntB antirepressor family protein [Saprospiraceae bacterium]|nr:antA/AntB antirepressor family protein [Saprospiraceae bacterium]